MKIITEGKLEAISPQWWVGQQMHCPYCMCIFELQEGDKVYALQERCPNGKKTVLADCPFCKNNGIKTQVEKTSHDLI